MNTIEVIFLIWLILLTISEISHGYLFRKLLKIIEETF